MQPEPNQGDVDRHFLRTIESLRRVNIHDDYELVKASGVLRQLLLDGGASLVVQVNRSHRLRLTYTVVDVMSDPYTKVVMEAGPTMYLYGDALHASIAFGHKETTALNLDAFLSASVGIYEAAPWTVGDTIRHCANVLGGVHFGKEPPSEDAEIERMRQLRVTIAGMRPVVLQLRSIIAIVLDGLTPLEGAIRAGFPSG